MSNKNDMYDKKSALRTFQPGDKVLVLPSLPGSSLRSQFSGPYAVEKKISDTNYVVQTPGRKRRTRVCHINMLKHYFPRDTVPQPPSAAPVGSRCAAPPVSPLRWWAVREEWFDAGRSLDKFRGTESF